MDLERALKIQGFTYEIELEWLAKQASTRKCIVEIGCWKGRSTRAMADNTTATLYAVDTWKGSAEDSHMAELKDKPADWLYEQFYENLNEHIRYGRVQILDVRNAVDLAKRRGLIPDMIFIDGAHDYESVKADILAWMPLLAKGGLFCGHDFDAGRPGVVRAVKELVPNYRVASVGSIWQKL